MLLLNVSRLPMSMLLLNISRLHEFGLLLNVDERSAVLLNVLSPHEPVRILNTGIRKRTIPSNIHRTILAQGARVRTLPGSPLFVTHGLRFCACTPPNIFPWGIL